MHSFLDTASSNKHEYTTTTTTTTATATAEALEDQPSVTSSSSSSSSTFACTSLSLLKYIPCWGDLELSIQEPHTAAHSLCENGNNFPRKKLPLIPRKNAETNREGM